ncbi:hypothetical protein PFLmoz3_05528 [Pseudomonas fluorescens]|uniref:Uncharacterized protein n=1 Tax=Pseudomonas fluorescens TaxID=294 RepID=A0A109LC71_PSEFL|nr:hypothetical protein PFLmoz3_05528 [Pseudomonas fluorescens]
MAPWPTGARVASSRASSGKRKAGQGLISTITSSRFSSRCQAHTWPKKVLPSTNCTVAGCSADSQLPAMLAVINSNHTTPVSSPKPARPRVMRSNCRSSVGCT